MFLFFSFLNMEIAFTDRLDIYEFQKNSLNNNLESPLKKKVKKGINLLLSDTIAIQLVPNTKENEPKTI